MDPIISDHVIVRWLERVGGVDLDFVREAIAADTRAAVAAGATRCRGANGVRYQLDPVQGSVVTVLTEEMRFGGRTARRSPRDFKQFEDGPDDSALPAGAIPQATSYIAPSDT